MMDVEMVISGGRDIPACYESCPSVSLMAVVSEDAIWQQAQDTVVDVHLSQGIRLTNLRTIVGYILYMTGIIGRF